MDVTSYFSSQSVSSRDNLNWVFLVDWILAFISCIAVIFFFNRAMAWAVSTSLNFVLWKRHKVRYKVQSFKISYLGGRVFFKNLTVISDNQIVFIHQGWFTWRYWLNASRKSDYIFDRVFKSEGDAENLRSPFNDSLPARFALEAYGLEIFMYNRTEVYDNILNFLNKHDVETPDDSADEKEGNVGLRQRKHVNTDIHDVPRTVAPIIEGMNELKINRNLGPYSLLRTLPIELSIKKASLVLGNENTSSLVVSSCSGITGELTIAPSKCSLDYYKIVSNLKLQKFQSFMKPNISSTKNLTPTSIDAIRAYKQKRRLQRLRRFLGSVVLKIVHKRDRKTLERDNSQKYEEMWPGLKRYLLDDNQDVRTYHYQSFEYAKFSQILESDYMHLVYYYDVPGVVPQNPPPTLASDGPDVRNGGPPPMAGMDIRLSKPIFHYGPWAERQRSTIHKAFFPSACRDALAFDKLKPGSDRIYTGFQLKAEIVDSGILIIPFREGSKNPQYHDQASTEHDSGETNSIRPFGWLELGLGKGSSIHSHVSYVPTPDGWQNHMDIKLLTPKLSSSVNHDVFFSAKEHSVSCDVGYPLKWNGPTVWTFNNHSLEANTFFLREHVTLIVDMLDDFASGDPVPYELFRPFTYKVKWNISLFAIYLNINDFNIIDNSTDFNDNSFVSFQGEDFFLDIEIPLDAVVRTSNTITYKLKTDFFDLRLDTPPWHTTNNFLKRRTVGRANNFEITGSYTYFSMVDIDSVDNIVIACTCDDTTLECYGFIVRYIMVIKENYFGDHIHFQTASEFTETKAKGSMDMLKSQSEELPATTAYRTENETDVLFSFCVNNGSLVLPGHLYDCESHVALHFSSLDIDIRFTNYYMDMQADFSPVYARLVKDCDPEEIFNVIIKEPKFKPELFIDCLSVHGHRMFGIPPAEPTYFCKWDFVSGNIVNHSSCEFIDGLSKAISNLGFGYKDVENALIAGEEVIHDAVALAFTCPLVDLNLRTGDDVLKCTLQPIDFKFNDLSNERYTGRMSLDIPSIIVTSFCVLSSDKLTMAFETSLKLTDFVQKEDMDLKRQLQQKHIQLHDGPFHRSPFILARANRAGKNNTYSQSYGSIKPSFSIPDLPWPLNEQTVDILIEDFPTEMMSAFSDGGSSSSFTSFEDSESDLRDFAVNKPIMAGDGFRPVLEYDDRDYTPQIKPDPKYEFDNIIVNVGSIRGFASPESCSTLVDIMHDMDNFDVKGVMDSLHIDIIDAVMRLHSTKCEAFNIRVVNPVLSFRFGEFNASSIDDVFDSGSKLPDHLVLEIMNPSLVVSKKVTRSRVQVKSDLVGKVEESLTGALHLREVVLGIRRADAVRAENEELVFRCSLQDLEFWFTDDETDGFTGSLNIRIWDNAIESLYLAWLGQYLSELHALGVALGKRHKALADNVRLSKIDLMHLVSAASVDHKVLHDPSVITKPSNVIRTSKDHIRYQDSWKVVTRLRHVIDSVPESWRKRTDALFRACKWDADSSARAEVLEVFSRWRTWEFSNIEHSYIFRFVFGGLKDTPVKGSAVQFTLESFALRLSAYDLEDDYIRLDYVSLGFMKTMKKVDDAFKKLVPDTHPDIHHIDITMGLSYLRSKFSLHCLRLKDFMETFKPIADHSEVQEVQIKDGIPSSFSFSCFLETFDNKVELSQIASNISGTGLTISAFALIPELKTDPMPLNVSLESELFSTEVHLNNMTLMGSAVKGGNMFFSSVGPIETGLKNVLLQAESIKLSAGNDTDDYVAFVAAVLEDELPRFDDIRALISKSQKPELSPLSSSSEHGLLDFGFPLSIKIETKSIDAKVQLLTPLRYVILSQNFVFKGQVLQGIFVSDLSVTKAASSLQANNPNGSGHTFVRADLSKFSVFLRVKSDPALLSVESSINMEHSRLSFPKVVDSTRLFYDIHEQIFDNVNKLKMAINRISKQLNPESTNSSPSASLPSIVFKVESLAEYMAIVVSGSSCELSLESRIVSLSCCNYTFNDGEKAAINRVRPHGWIKFPSTRLVVAGSNLPHNKFEVMEVDFEMKLLEPEKEDQRYQSFQILSQWCRFVLSPSVLIKFLVLGHDLREALLPFLDKKSSEKISEPVVKKIEPSESMWSSFSLHMLSHNMCIGWLFEEGMMDVEDIPGLIAGYEKAYITSAKGMGKVSMVGAYLSRAHGDQPSNFYSTSSEIDKLDRAFFPGFQLTYVIAFTDEGKRIRTRLKGEQLDFRVHSRSLLLLDKMWRSFTAVEKVIKQLEKVATPRKHIQLSSTEKTEDLATSLGINFIDCLMTFDGASISISRPDLSTEDEKASLFLRAPAVNIAAEYHKASKGGKHVLKWEVLTSSSENILYAACVPVILDVYRGCRSLMRSSQSPSAEIETSQKAKLPSTKSGFDISNFVDMFDICFALRIEPQTLSLSCEPTAKVEAIVSFDGIDIHFNTIESKGISGAVEIENVIIKLQHVYSRQTSGSIVIEDFLLSGIMKSQKQGESLVTVGSISDVNGYVNMTQLQDLDLFRDIWMPNEFFEQYVAVDEEVLDDSADPKTFAARVKEVSSTAAFPWFLNFNVLNVGFTVDLGKSLGVVTLSLDRVWAFSRKTIDWEQNFKLEFNNFRLTSKGRLGGELELNKLRLHSAIAWERDHESIPSVLLSAGFDSLQAKASFDFHTFFIADIQTIGVKVYNQKGVGVLDSLVASGHVGSIQLFLTALSASNFLEIYHTGQRMHHDINLSYNEVLHDSAMLRHDDLRNTTNSLTRARSVILNHHDLNMKSKKKAVQDFAHAIVKLKTALDVSVEAIDIHIYPSSLLDSQVLVMQLGSANAAFTQDQEDRVASKLNLKLKDVKVALSTVKNSAPESALQEVEISKYVKHAKTAKGGTIFVFPSLAVSMSTWQHNNSNTVEYIYESSFGGKVDVRWNLGSINFIREMWTVHANALSTRLNTRRLSTLGETDGEEVMNNSTVLSIFETVNIEDRLKNVEEDKQFIYVPIVSPRIETPQLKELGDATPPLEWFGLHRDKFPNLTHQVIIMGLQKIVEAAETQYARVLK